MIYIRVIENNLNLVLLKAEHYNKAFDMFQKALDLEIGLLTSNCDQKRIREIENNIDNYYSKGLKIIIDYALILRSQNIFKESIYELMNALSLTSLLINLEIQNNKFDYILELIKETRKERIKAILLKLGSNYVRLQISDIAQAYNEEKDLIKSVILEMIERFQIHAKYFKSTKSIMFDIYSNIKILNKLTDKDLIDDDEDKWENMKADTILTLKNISN